MPVKRSTAIQVQLKNFTSEITVEFLATKNEITHCVMGMEFLYNFDCILNTRIAAEGQELTSRCEGFIRCKNVDEEGNITQQTEIIVEPMKKFEDKSHLLIARPLNNLVDDFA